MVFGKRKTENGNSQHSSQPGFQDGASSTNEASHSQHGRPPSPCNPSIGPKGDERGDAKKGSCDLFRKKKETPVADGRRTHQIRLPFARKFCDVLSALSHHPETISPEDDTVTHRPNPFVDRKQISSMVDRMVQKGDVRTVSLYQNLFW